MSEVMEEVELRGEPLVRSCLRQGSSGRGVSYYMKLMECPKKVLLNEQAEKEGELPQWSRAMLVGIFFHKLAELYHTGRDVGAMPTEVDGEIFISGCLQEAWRLFEFYSSYTPIDGWGRVVAAEGDVRTEIPAAGGTLGGLIAYPLTGRLDLLTDAPEGHPIAVEHNGPGEYILDYKTHERKPSEVFMKDQYSMQYVNYMWQRFLKTGKWVRGTLVHHLVTHKNLEVGQSCMTTFISPPTEHEIEKLKNFVISAATLPRGLANVSRCFVFGTCAHLVTGRCNQMSEGV